MGLIDYIVQHGFLMLFGWGVCIPAAITSARFFKRKGKVWFYVHVGGNILGLFLATVGFGIALKRFGKLWKSGNGLDTTHARIGIAVMVMGYTQPLLALVRPHAAPDAQELTFKRRVWNLAHWFLGKTTVLLALSNIIIGLHLCVTNLPLYFGPEYPHHSAVHTLQALVYFFIIGWGVLWLAILFPYEYLVLEPKKGSSERSGHEGTYRPPPGQALELRKPLMD